MYIRAADYLLRRINAIEEPVVAEARQAKAKVLEATVALIAGLHWKDFEVMVDLIFARTGWQRISSLGGTLKDIDLALKHPTTGETAFVQVKSRADQAVFDDYLARFSNSGIYDRMFFICHSPEGELQKLAQRHIHVWSGTELADAAMQAGLLDWLLRKSSW